MSIQSPCTAARRARRMLAPQLAAVHSADRKGECEMKRWTRTAAVGLAVTAMTLPLAACNQSVSTEGDGELMPLQIGVVAPLTGPTASIGQAQACGALVARDALNALATNPGEEVELFIEDSKADPAEAARVAGELTSEGIVFFQGGPTTSEVAAQLPIFADAGAITTAGTSQALSILTSGARVARLQPDTSVAGAFAAQFLLDEFDVSKVAMLTQDIEYSQEMAKGATDALGTDVEVSVQSVPFDEVTFASQIDALLATDPDAFFLPIAGFDKQLAFIREYTRTGTDVPLALGLSILNAPLVDAGGADLEGVYGFDSWNMSVQNDASTQMREDFEAYAPDHAECVDTNVSIQGLIEYSSVKLYHAAAAMAGTRDAGEVYQAILENDWDMPQGVISFSASGQAVAPQIAVQVVGGEIVSVE
ncbi:ABC transporter substrate-binding protein [Microcella sp.]|uniref:ABC transporter substrate-binding protein n=1 Tax=Microcella sp. TaxID=1913979 RepID=UPI002564F8B1|nr:ABC transporter substrate-binding protein [Microcella sp.]MBX9472388.1 ABC transporter substrate-binding protein [Microcella sp.]